MIAIRLTLIAIIVITTAMFPAATPAPGMGLRASLLEQPLEPNDRFGIAHISYGDRANSGQRYRVAREAGVGWDRWVFYWNAIEPSPGYFNYRTQDAAVEADRANGLKVLGVLFATPRWASSAARVADLPTPQVGRHSYPEQVRLQAQGDTEASSASLPPRGLEEPVFADGSDVPGADKTINPNNPWARFVFNTAQRYQGRVGAWEIWNDPDFSPKSWTGWFGFWNGDLRTYARMLKVAYLSVKHADPEATVVMGSLAYWFQNDFFPKLLTEIKKDGAAAANNYYFDASGWHWYSRASQLYERTLWVKETMQSAGLPEKPIWITETNLPVCGDLILAEQVRCDPGAHRGRPDQQSAYILQAIGYALAAGVEKMFIFQLFDDDLGPGEYFGLVRNSGSPRPAYQALQVATQLFRDVEQAYRTPNAGNQVEMVTVNTKARDRVRIVWNQGGRFITTSLPIESASAQLVAQDRTTTTVSAQRGHLFPLALPIATLDDYPGPEVDFIVGGTPYVLLEKDVPQGAAALQGAVIDSGGRPLAGVPLSVGERNAVTDSQGRYRVELLPGIYDVSLDQGHPFAGLSTPRPALAVWSGVATTEDFTVRGLQHRFIPFIVKRNP